jgi:hypothetical protein
MQSGELRDEQRELWSRVEELWRRAAAHDEPAIRAALHPSYSGWEFGKPKPHDKEYAVRSVVSGPISVLAYELMPLEIEICDAAVGVVHYLYRATIAPDRAVVTGRWTEVYMKRDGAWVMVTVSGGPDRKQP